MHIGYQINKPHQMVSLIDIHKQNVIEYLYNIILR